LCHLAIEKALKAIYYFKLKEDPPKIHDLKTLVRIMNLNIPGDIEPFVGKLTAISIPARYPEDLKSTLKKYDKKATRIILNDSKKVLKWVKTELTRK
jgi:HEPN domain-containing protein